MSFDFPEAAPRRPGPARPRRRLVLLPTIAVLVVLVLLFGIFASFWTDWLWYRSISFQGVFRTELLTRAVLFVVFGLAFAVLVLLNVVLARRTRAELTGLTPDDVVLARYQRMLDPLRRVILIAAGILLFLFAGSTASSEWATYQQWAHATPFGTRDPQFHKDVSFFVFTLPWWQFLLSFAFAIVVASIIVALASHWLYGGLRVTGRRQARTTTGARVHLSVLLGIFVLLKAIGYWLDRYALATADGQVGRESFTGLTYTDVNAVLPGKTILAVIALICAVLFFATIFTRSWLLPGVGVGLLVLSALLVGGIYPAIVQYFQVRPTENQKESPYLTRFIGNTRQAYAINDTTVNDYVPQADPKQVDASSGVPGIRLLDPAVVSPTFQQLQQIRQYYSFPDSLDVDRYTIGGRERDAVVAVREINLDGVPSRNWINDHTVYTHGFGFVGAYGTQVTDGKPDFFESDLPSKGVLPKFQPRVYFGEESPSYSIVGGKPGGRTLELDYPSVQSPTGQANYTYDGKGGVPIGSLWNRILFATRFQESNILLSDVFTPQSKILFDREPRDRVEKAAPWLTVDGDPYPAVVDGRIVWIVDGYTTSNSYPYSKRTVLGDTTADSLTATTSAVAAQIQAPINYIRNSVKATVDAYDGTVTLYAWDESDPVLKTWERVFPGSVKPKADISSALMAHLRYPEDFFKVQRALLAKFHVTDPQAFYSGQDFWRVPDDPTNEGSQREDQPPYYLSTQLPGQSSPSFSLTTTYIPQGNKANLTGFLSVNSQPGKDYGKLTLLKLPSNSTIPGPGQAHNNFEATPAVGTTLTLLRQGGSQVTRGNLLTLPFGGGFIYVEPVYVSANTGGTSYPLLQKVLVGFADKVGFADTLDQALAQVFTASPTTGGNGGTGNGGTGNGGTGNGGTGNGGTGNGGTGNGGTGSGGTTSPSVAQALSDAQKALADAQKALQSGDFAAYGEAQKRLQDAINRAVSASQSAAKPSTSPTTSPSSSPSPSATSGASPSPSTTSGA
ncbi:MAG: UPF0182 family membrane protein [Actinomycetes bacterium]